jgi:hypothetical protein
MPEAPPPPFLAELVPDAEYVPLVTLVETGWSRFNPSLVRRSDGRLQVSIRSSNYRIDENGGYEVDDPAGVVRSRTSLATVDGSGVGPAALILEPDGLAVGGRVRGYEDIRLFEHRGALGALATVRDRDVSGICRIALLQLEDDGTVTRERMIAGPDPQRHEKNWVPMPDDGSGRLRVVYSWDPLRIGVLDVDDGSLAIGDPVPTPWANARGSSGGVRLESTGEDLFVVHERILLPDWRPCYLHRFVALADGRPARASRRFAILGRDVEFAAGLVIDGEHLLLSFGSRDEEAWLVRLPQVSVVAALQPIRRVAA